MNAAAPAGAAATALSALVVDDEPLARQRLAQLLRQAAASPGMPRFEAIAEAGDTSQAEAALAEAAFDVAFLDIGMPGRDGLKLADALRRLSSPPQVVFVTAHAEHALKAFDLDATDYLTKPVRRDRLHAALARLLQRRPAPPPAAAEAPALARVLVFSERGRVLRVPLADILYLKAEQKYVQLVTAAARWWLDESLAELEPRLGPGFLRIHRNALVARAALRAVAKAPLLDAAAPAAPEELADEGWVAQLVQGEKLAVSRRQLAAVREALAASPPGPEGAG